MTIAISAFYERTVVTLNDLSADIAALSACAMGITEITHSMSVWQELLVMIADRNVKRERDQRR
jgi:hypothetical protein